MEPRYQDETNWKDLLTHPSKLFGYAYVYFLVIITALGVLYLKNINNSGKNAVVPQVLKDSTAFVLDIPLQAPRVLPPVDIMKVGVANDSLLARGKELFKPTCAPCHGETGVGDGPSAPTLNPKPRNFHSLDGWKNGSKVSQMYKTLQEGIPGGGMAAFNYIPPTDLFAMIHYVRTLATPQPMDSEEELKALDPKYSLSKGMNLPGQIPIVDAIVKVSKETKPVADVVKKALAEVSTSQAEGALLLRTVVADQQKVIVSVLHAKAAGVTVDAFVKNASGNPGSCGFKGKAAQLTAGEWNSLVQYVMSLV